MCGDVLTKLFVVMYVLSYVWLCTYSVMCGYVRTQLCVVMYVLSYLL